VTADLQFRWQWIFPPPPLRKAPEGVFAILVMEVVAEGSAAVVEAAVGADTRKPWAPRLPPSSAVSVAEGVVAMDAAEVVL